MACYVYVTRHPIHGIGRQVCNRVCEDNRYIMDTVNTESSHCSYIHNSPIHKHCLSTHLWSRLIQPTLRPTHRPTHPSIQADYGPITIDVYSLMDERWEDRNYRVGWWWVDLGNKPIADTGGCTDQYHNPKPTQTWFRPQPDLQSIWRATSTTDNYKWPSPIITSTIAYNHRS